MRTIFDEKDRAALMRRVDDLDERRSPRWGKLTAPAMIAHLCDQLRMALGDHDCTPVPGIWRSAPFRAAFLYIPGPFGKHQKGPPEAFATPSEGWSEDMKTLRELMDRLVVFEPEDEWPEHPNLGRMSRRGWGVFTYRHFDHHLKQFGA